MSAIWLFDGVCVLCSSAVRYTLAHEKAPTIQFVAIQSDQGRKLARSHGIDPDWPDSFLFIEHGLALKKSDGVLALAKHLGGIFRFAPLGRIIPRAVRDWAYDKVATNRYAWFGRKDACLVPDPQTLQRFVLPILNEAQK
jgi:predicted DCC family thiol-disulfide oxidoreductase YuxK